MKRLGVINYLTLALPKLLDDVISVSKQPLVVSHSDVDGSCNNIRKWSAA